MRIIDRLLRYRHRKMLMKREPLKIKLNEKHQREIERFIKSVDLNLDDFRRIGGYRILGMTIKGI